MKKRDVLIQNPNDLSYVGLCSNGIFKMKKQLGNEFSEVIWIEKKDENEFEVTMLHPLVEKQQKVTYKWCEEALYNLIPHTPELTSEDRKKVMNYFGEK